MTDKLREAAQQALEALEAVQNDAHGTSFPATVSCAITDLCAALAQRPADPAQEPAAWMNPDDGRVIPAQTMQHAREGGGASLSSVRSYTVPLGPIRAQRPPLTDAEMLDIIDDAMEGGSLLDLVRAIERKVRGETE